MQNHSKVCTVKLDEWENISVYVCFLHIQIFVQSFTNSFILTETYLLPYVLDHAVLSTQIIAVKIYGRFCTVKLDERIVFRFTRAFFFHSLTHTFVLSLIHSPLMKPSSWRVCWTTHYFTKLDIAATSQDTMYSETWWMK